MAGKWSENAWRVALVLHVSEHPESPADHPLSVNTAERAIAIVRWFAAQSLLLVGPMREEKEDSRAARLATVLSNTKYDRSEGVTHGTLRKSHGFTSSELDRICEIHRHRFEAVDVGPSGKGGRPTVKVPLRA